MDLHQLFQTRLSESHAVHHKVGDKLRANLESRSRLDRSEVEDRQLFGPASTAAYEAFNAGECDLAITILNLAYDLAHEYEQQTHRQIHKGAITFDLGLYYLARNDFSAAMRYFEIAESETQTTRQGSPYPTFEVYHSEIFTQNFWRSIGRKLEKYPLTEYQTLWGLSFGEGEARDDWEHLSHNSQLLYLISLARRMHYYDVASATAGYDARSLSLERWNLSADLARIVETELRKKAQCPTGLKTITLGRLLTQCFKHTRTPKDLSTMVCDPSSDYTASDTESFNRTFSRLQAKIENGPTWEDKIAGAARLLLATRNQVAHHIDDTMILFYDERAARFTVDVLFSLCRINAWTD